MNKNLQHPWEIFVKNLSLKKAATNKKTSNIALFIYTYNTFITFELPRPSMQFIQKMLQRGCILKATI